jgi:hypothetical protein
MVRVAKNSILLFMIGAAIFVIGTALSGNGMCPLSQQEAGMSGGICCSWGYTQTGSCSYYTDPGCENSATCSSQPIASCGNWKENVHVAGHKYYCNNNPDYHCKASLLGSEHQPCAIEYGCYVYQNQCTRFMYGDPVNERTGCAYHDADSC